MAGYRPRSLFAFLWTPKNKNTKRELGQYLAILTSRLVNNIYIYIGITRDLGKTGQGPVSRTSRNISGIFKNNTFQALKLGSYFVLS